MRNSTLTGLIALPVLLAGSAAAAVSINAAGATFPEAIYQKWFQEFTAAQINYQAVGSGAGITQLTKGTVDFGASDKPMSDKEIADCKVKPLHFPTVLGAVVMTYNVSGVSTDLKLTPEAIAGIYLGEIKKWNDPKIAGENKGVNLPNADIVVVHRSDGSGTTFVFTEYLSKVSPAWSKVGVGPSVSWPVSGLAGKGNPGVAGIIKQTPNSIGYVELVFAAQNKMAIAQVKNKAGKYVKASVESVTAAAAASKDMPEDFRTSITDAPGATSYPISSFTYLLIPSEIPDAAKKKAIVDFLGWMLTAGQKDAPGLYFAQLPASVVAKEKKQIALIK
jgi:phosphate transport system substrate-binding protein